MRGALLAVGLLAACSGDDAGPEEAAPTAEAVAPAALQETWPVLVADDVVRGPYEANRGWMRLVSHRDFKSAAGMLGKDQGLGVAHVHADAAAMFRQAALLAAHSYIETYGVSPQKTDPAGTVHLLAVSYALTGDLDKARAAAKKVDPADEALKPWHAPWSSWLEGDAVWPPDLAALPTGLPAETLPGTWPELRDMPHYKLPEQEGSDYTVEYGDPGALVALAMWHEAAAVRAAGPEHAAAVKVYGGRYHLPVEPKPAAADLPLELLFGSDFLVPGDASFLSDVVHDGPAAVDKHQATSLLARVAAAARRDGKIAREPAIDLASDVREGVLAASVQRSGDDRAFHRPFADVARVAVLRGLALVAEAEGNREESGVLRINALDRSVEAAASPEYLLSLAAWDAANRYPMRALDIMHNLIRRYPSLTAARYGLDVLALRVSRQQVDQGVGM